MKKKYIRIEKQEFYQLMEFVEKIKKGIQNLQKENKVRFNIEPQINCLEKDIKKLTDFTSMLNDKYKHT